MWGSIKYNLVNLTNFNGRDARQTFWYYVLAIVVVQFMAGLAVTIPMMVDGFTTAFQAAQEGVDRAALEQQMNAQMMATMQDMMWISIGISLVCALLLVAALVRRLRDSDHSGWWVALPLGLYAYVLARTPAQMDRAMEMMDAASSGTPSDPVAMLQGQAADTLIAWLPYAAGIVIGVLKSTPGPNRFGDSPVSF